MKRLVPLAMVLLMLVGACARAERADSGSTAAPVPSSTSTTTSTSIGTAEPDPVEEETLAQESLPDLGRAEALRGIDGWLQTDVESLGDLKGKVVVVQFWTFGCHNCKATIPNLEALYAEHEGADFEIVGIHSPEFDYEKDPDAIAAAAEDLGVTWPIALDTARQSFRSWQGSPAYWPRTYVLDREGHIRFDHIGEGAYEELNQTVAILLG
jgi:thiol-disulfide isomerase/thioredoxin